MIDEEATLFTRGRIAAFFAGAAFAAWLLYPNEYFLGLMHRAEADRGVSIEHFREFLAENPHHKGATLALVRALESDARPEEAVPVLRALYEHRRGDPKIGAELLDLLHRSGRLEAAQDFRWKLFQDLKGSPAAERRELEWLLYRHYQEAVLAQDREAEGRALRALVEHAKEAASFRWERMRLLMVSEEYGELAALMEARVAEEPSDLSAWGTLVDARRAQRRYSDALAALEKALALHPGHPDLLTRRVSVRAATGDWERSLPDLRALRERDPSDAALRRALAYHTLRAGRVEAAAALYRSEVERAPGDREAWWDLIRAWAENGRPGRAADALREYLRRFPDDGEAVDLLVAQLDRMGRRR